MLRILSQVCRGTRPPSPQRIYNEEDTGNDFTNSRSHIASRLWLAESSSLSLKSTTRTPTPPAPSHVDDTTPFGAPRVDEERALSLSRAASLHSSLLDVREAAAFGLPTKKARRATAQNHLAYSKYRPHVPADRRLLLWTTPHSVAAHAAMEEAGISLALQTRVFETLLQAHVPETRESYGAGLLRFNQFSDREGIPEADRMPASRLLLAAFVADAAGSCTGKCIRAWLNGLHLWHTYNDAPWHGDEGWLPALKRAADKAGAGFKRPPRGPITRAHLRALRASVDISSPPGAAIWAVAFRIHILKGGLSPYHIRI
ncbi:hypothetical protein C8R46DRAFT_1037758 [Mycena filopes]|nr:hypothetical protein C8R46DRAFT_1283779 [Mycena filopes]KAJ7161560.1 hypothetical protein C8R46DRAFT_1037758 [Mycena filopes]